MLKIKTMPVETLVELLHFLAENEKFPSVSKHLMDGMSVGDVRSALRELACEITRVTKSEQCDGMENMKREHLSDRAKEVISMLSPCEEKKLFGAFGLGM